MFFEDKEEIKYLRKKYPKEKIIVFTGGKKKIIKKWRKIFAKVLSILSKELNYDIYIFDPEEDKSLQKFGTVFHYDETCIKAAMYKIEDLVASGCTRAFVLNTDIIDKRLLNENLKYRFLFLYTIKTIYRPEIQPNNEINIGGADIFNIVRDIEALQTEKICYCNKECLKEFIDNEYKYKEHLSYLRLEKNTQNKHIKIIDALLE